MGGFETHKSNLRLHRGKYFKQLLNKANCKCLSAAAETILMYCLLRRNAHPLPAPVNGNWITSSHCPVAGVMPLYQVSCEAGHLWLNLSPRFLLLTVKIPYVYSKTTCLPDTFRKVCVGVCCRSSKSWPYWNYWSWPWQANHAISYQMVLFG